MSKKTNRTINTENLECQEDDGVIEDKTLVATEIMEMTTKETVDNEITECQE